VAEKAVAWHGTRAMAILAEQAAIESAAPRYNQTLSPQSVPPPPGGVMSLRELHRLCDAYKASHRALADAVTEELARGADIGRIARSVDWSREYIARICKEREAGKEPAEPPR
jgi:hypothetical protein